MLPLVYHKRVISMALDAHINGNELLNLFKVDLALFQLSQDIDFQMFSAASISLNWNIYDILCFDMFVNFKLLLNLLH